MCIRETAILMVSFGTTHLDALERSITATERAVAERFPEYPVYRAFLNAAVIRSLKERHALQVDNVAEALARMEEDGCKKAVIQPTLLLRGAEYELLVREAQQTGMQVSTGRPLLENAQDCEILASIIIEETRCRKGKPWCLWDMGQSMKPMPFITGCRICLRKKTIRHLSALWAGYLPFRTRQKDWPTGRSAGRGCFP